MAATVRSPPFAEPIHADRIVSAKNPLLPPNGNRGAHDGADTEASNEAQTPFGSVDLSTIHVDTHYWSCETLRPSANIHAFLKKDFDVSRLDEVYDLLWWAGRQVPPRPLHRLKMLGRKIVITEQADLHLVWSVESVFVKPLPDFFLIYSFWTTYICNDKELYESARGFVLSYIWLIRYKSDFEIAKEKWLLPSDLTWPVWRAFVESVWQRDVPSHPGPISKRYRYGELRISRLDQIYRFRPRFLLSHLMQGYLYSYSSYGGFFRREFAWLVVAFAYLSIVLSAMQVGLATYQLKDNDGFNKGSYGFSVASIIFPLAVITIALLLYIVLWLYHVITTFCAWLGGRKKERLTNSNVAATD
ncbi:hypothetical protein F5882DRAFT_317592 [Hyaloscypha sp. PMI_1271]|nr:hypothetical protein F5882DRAFT_317592 [Hyaloscypha sp. PMI_1271]